MTEVFEGKISVIMCPAELAGVAFVPTDSANAESLFNTKEGDLAL